MEAVKNAAETSGNKSTLLERKVIPLEWITATEDMQPRAELSKKAVEEYAESYKNEESIDPIVVFYEYDKFGGDHVHHWLADGFHRLAALKKNGTVKKTVELHKGTKREALLYAIEANAKHRSLRFSNADKRRAVTLLLKDDEWSKKSARWIADKCGVSDPFVGKLRSELQTVSSSEPRIGADGKLRKMPTRPALTLVSPPATPPRPSPSDDIPADRWQCKGCNLLWPHDVKECRHCAAAETSDAVDDVDDSDEDFNPDEELWKVNGAFDDMMMRWPREESLEPVIKHLKTKLGMTIAEFRQKGGVWEEKKTQAFDLAALDRLREQRNADPCFINALNIAREAGKQPMCEQQSKMAFICDGGEVALLRLGLDWTVTPESLKKAYKAATLKAHPDHGGSHEEMTAINRAHELVKNYVEGAR